MTAEDQERIDGRPWAGWPDDDLPAPLFWRCPAGHSPRDSCGYCGETLCGWSHDPNSGETCPRCQAIRYR